ncbi:probable leucine-rich repeat receptor-like protein kinase, partial [Tanacetum coccineum]
CKVVVGGGIERGFLSQKGSGVGRGVKEKSINKTKTNTVGIGLFMTSDGNQNEVTLVSAIKEVETLFVVDMTVEKEKLSSVEDTIVLGFFLPLSKPVTTSTGNAPGKRVAYPVVANYVRNTWGKYGLVRSMFSSSTGLFSFQFRSMYGLDAMLENGLWFIRNHPLILKKWNPDENLLKEDGRSSYARVMIELRADVELKDNIIVAMLKVIGEGYYIFNIHVEYEWKPPRPVPKKPTASSSGNKKKGVVPSIEVSNSIPFEALNPVENDMELGTNRGTTNLVNNEAISSGFSLINIDNSSIRTTPIIDKIRKFKELLTSGKATLVDKAGNPLKKVEFVYFFG